MRFDFALLADFAQVVQGKLYLQGGGLTRLTANSLPWTQSVAICSRLEPEPDDDLSRQWHLEVAVLGPHEVQIFAHGAAMTLDRPAVAPAEGERPGVLIALTVNNLVLRAYGPHRVALAIDGERAQVPFTVLPPEASG